MRKDIIIYKSGDIVGTATFIEIADSKNGRRAIFKCKCGNSFETYISKVETGNIKGCGCWKVQHGHTVGSKNGGKRSSEYMAWLNMIKRCYSKSNVAYHNYGGRGIVICERWLHSFENFISDMGLKPSKKHSIDRQDNDGNYEPDNCRWVLKKVQARNQRSNVFLTHNNETLCLSAWSEKIGIKNSNLWARLNRGWSIADIIKEADKNCNSKRVVNVKTGEVFNSITAAAKSIGVNRNVIGRKLSGSRNDTDKAFRYLE